MVKLRLGILSSWYRCNEIWLNISSGSTFEATYVLYIAIVVAFLSSSLLGPMTGHSP